MPVVDLPSLKSKIEDSRRRGNRVVFTNGCFDLLHIGHLRYLAAARTLGDLLVVGINSDSSVRLIKGPGRPIVPQEERSELVAGLAAVDFVVLFDESTPYTLIETLAPDVLVKGGDWSLEEIVGADLVSARGGRVETVPIVPSRSTTALVETVLSLPP